MFYEVFSASGQEFLYVFISSTNICSSHQMFFSRSHCESIFYFGKIAAEWTANYLFISVWSRLLNEQSDLTCHLLSVRLLDCLLTSETQCWTEKCSLQTNQKVDFSKFYILRTHKPYLDDIRIRFLCAGVSHSFWESGRFYTVWSQWKFNRQTLEILPMGSS